MVLSPMYRGALGCDTLNPWLLSTLVLRALHDTYGVATQRRRQERIYGKLEKAAHRK